MTPTEQEIKLLEDKISKHCMGKEIMGNVEHGLVQRKLKRLREELEKASVESG